MNTAVNVARRGGLFEPIPPIPFPSLWRSDTRPTAFAAYVTMVLIAERFLATGLIPVWLFLFKFSALQTAGLWLWAVAEAVPSAILGFAFVRTVAKSGVLS